MLKRRPQSDLKRRQPEKRGVRTEKPEVSCCWAGIPGVGRPFSQEAGWVTGLSGRPKNPREEPCELLVTMKGMKWPVVDTQPFKMSSGHTCMLWRRRI